MVCAWVRKSWVSQTTLLLISNYVMLSVSWQHTPVHGSKLVASACSICVRDSSHVLTVHELEHKTATQGAHVKCFLSRQWAVYYGFVLS
jgi:hypothetical protein